MREGLKEAIPLLTCHGCSDIKEQPWSVQFALNIQMFGERLR
jgi:hypothetical protein